MKTKQIEQLIEACKDLAAKRDLKTGKMNSKELRIGNYIKTPSGKILPVRDISIDLITLKGDMVNGNLQKFIPEDISPVSLTEELLLRLGCRKNKINKITSTYNIDIGRGRFLSISDIGTPNAFIHLCYKDQDSLKIEDIITLYNWDYDKEIYLHQFQNLIFSLTGEELILAD